MFGEEEIVGLKKTLIQILNSKILPSGCYLAGETALYFYLNHRISVDLDFFTPKIFKAENLSFKIRRHFDIVDVEIMEEESLILFLSMEKIKFSLFHFPYPLLSNLIFFELEKGVKCPIASHEDIEAMKAISLVQRGSAKDFVDLFYLLQNTGHNFSDIVSYVRKKYKLEAKYAYHLKTAMVYFDDAEKEIGEILLVDQSGKIRPVSQREWQDMKQFFIGFCQ